MNRRSFLKSGVAVAAASLLPATVRSATAPLSVRWLGGAMMEIEAAGLRILTDPCLGEGEEAFVMGDPNEMFDLAKGPNIKTHARLTPFPGLKHSSPDLVLLSHLHEDHFDQKAQAWLDRSLPLLAPEHDTEHLRQQGYGAQALRHGATRVFNGPSGEVRVTALPAVHSLNPQISAVLGLGNGYMIEARRGAQVQRLYWAGDTFHAEPVAQALTQQDTPDLFIPHIGAVGGEGALGQISMDGGQAMDFAAQVGAHSVLPVHHTTYSLFREGPEVMQRLHAALRPDWNLLLPGEGREVLL
ncbi:L-ascorbate metabolism protein UlaG (beta-lactamase superfamily) [Ruegeria sp. P4]|nr:L-ascorbate metabolism protein UlaG (beta-lactamase superfamily) [Ruegeria sp. P4]